MPTPTLVLLHGFTQTGRSWAPTIAALGERYRALAPDLRGHGTAAATGPVSFVAVAQDILALAPERFALAGYSMGGRIALHIALAAPDRIERLALISASPGLADAGERAVRRTADEALAGEIERDDAERAALGAADEALAAERERDGAERTPAAGMEGFARRWGAQALFAGQPAAVAGAAHADRLRNTPEGLAAALRGLGTGVMEPLWDRLHELAMPVALITGERDAKFRAIAEQMAAAIPHAVLHVIPETGHAPQLEEPEVVATLL